MRRIAREEGICAESRALESLEVMRRRGKDVVARSILSRWPVGRGIVVDGFRALEELSSIRIDWSDLIVIGIQASHVLRYKRALARARMRDQLSWDQWLEEDSLQASMGILSLPLDKIADIVIVNESTTGELRNTLFNLAAAIFVNSKDS